MKKTLIMTLMLLLAVTIITASAWTYWVGIQTGWTGANASFDGRGILNNYTMYDMCWTCVFWQKDAYQSGDKYFLTRKRELQAASSSVLEWNYTESIPSFVDINFNVANWGANTFGTGMIIAKICAPYTYAYGTGAEIAIEIANRANVLGIAMWEIGIPESATNRQPIWYPAAAFAYDANLSLSTLVNLSLPTPINGTVIPSSIIWSL